MELDIKETGKYIRQYRKIAGLTQEELAQKVGVSTMSIRRYESGERVATRELIEAIAGALGVDPYSLYSFDQVSDALVERINARDRVDVALGKLNDAGMEKVADVVEIIAEVPRYKAAETAPQSPPASQEGKDTTPPPDAPETPPEEEWGRYGGDRYGGRRDE